MTTTEERIGWTVAQLDWIPWVPTVYESNYPPEFIAEIEGADAGRQEERLFRHARP